MTQQEFDAIERNEFGVKVIPAFTDLTQIKVFGNYCRFGENCIFGEKCSFGKFCSFGNYCSFGEKCSFGKFCSFGNYCSFGENCRFSNYCRFGENCRFSEKCKLNNKIIIDYKAVDRVGNYERKLYCWNLENVLYFQAGCFFGTKKELLEKVNAKYEKGSEYHLAITFLTKIIK